jgi:hypothetical protein
MQPYNKKKDSGIKRRGCIMNIIMYLLSKTYRDVNKSEYTKDLCSKISHEETCQEEIYETVIGAGKN